MQNHLIVGQSGSGKTRVAVRLIRQYRAGENGHLVSHNPVLVLNGSADVPSDYKRAEWSTVLEEARECSLLVDDILAPDKAVLRTLRELLNKHCRHKRISPVCLVLHSINNTGAVSLLPFINYIWLTATTSNENSLRYLLTYYRFPLDQTTEITERFKHASGLSDYSAFQLDVGKKLFTHVSGSGDSGGEGGGSEERERDSSPSPADFFASAAKTCIDLLPQKEKANATFKMLVECLPRRLMDPKDLTITLSARNSDQSRKISLVDYIATLQDRDLRPSSTMRMLHHYVSGQVRLPDILVDNAVLKNRGEEDRKGERTSREKKTKMLLEQPQK